jgi:hypothetical protein
MQLKDVSELVEAVLTSAAIVAAAIWTYMLFVKKRQKYPRIKVEHEETHWAVSPDEYLLRVAVRILNIGEVLVPVESVSVRIQQIRPWRNDALGSIVEARRELTLGTSQLGWPVLDERKCEWRRGVQEIEPGEKDEFIYDFIVDKGVEAVSVYSYVKNAYKKLHPIRRWRIEEEIGWNTTTVHELDQKEIKK